MATSHKFGTGSRAKLLTCNIWLEKLAERALSLSPVDFTIVHGYRGQALQDSLQTGGSSTKTFPNSKHNVWDAGNNEPSSEALDFGPWLGGTIPWDDTHLFCVIAGCFFAAAAELAIKIRWGGDWDMDGSTMDQTLMDFGHIEILLGV